MSIFCLLDEMVAGLQRLYNDAGTFPKHKSTRETFNTWPQVRHLICEVTIGADWAEDFFSATAEHVERLQHQVVFMSVPSSTMN